jgi:S1-C subfamily serine protease
MTASTSHFDEHIGRPRRHISVWPAALVTVVAAVVAFGAGSHFARGGSGNSAVPASSQPINPTAAAAAVDGAIVDVNTDLALEDAQAAGTGIVLSATGDVLTNNHVVEGSTSITATEVSTGRQFTGAVVGYDVSNDVAVIHLSGASGLRTARLGNSSKLAIGDAVAAVGNAGGVGGTPRTSPGAVTALNQSITAADANGVAEQLGGLIQTSDQLIAGDSGGPLVNAAGQVVGMDTAGSSRFTMRTQQAFGFAIPIDKAVSIAREIEAARGSSTIHIGPTAFLGVAIAPPTGAPTSPTGALVAGAVPGSPAAAAGIGQGDVVTELASAAVTSPSDLSSMLLRYHPGDTVDLTWVGPTGLRHTATVRLGNGPVG